MDLGKFLLISFLLNCYIITTKKLSSGSKLFDKPEGNTAEVRLVWSVPRDLDLYIKKRSTGEFIYRNNVQSKAGDVTFESDITDVSGSETATINGSGLYDILVHQYSNDDKKDIYEGNAIVFLKINNRVVGRASARRAKRSDHPEIWKVGTLDLNQGKVLPLE